MHPTAAAPAPIRSAPRAEAGRLDSWKEIAAYLRRGARTVQRWEREEGLPIRRLRHDKLGSVYAYTHELDSWFSAREAPFRAAPAVAVLPFSDMSPDKSLRYLCDGVAEEIAMTLGTIEGLKTVVRGAEPRGVQSLVTGSVRRSGDRLRIAARIVTAGTGFHLWGESFDRGLGDVLDLEEEIAERVKEALQEIMGNTREAGPCGPVPIAAGQRAPGTSRTPANLESSRGARDGITA